MDPFTYEVDSFVYAVSVAVPDPPVQHQQILNQIAINRLEFYGMGPTPQSSFLIRNLLVNPYNIAPPLDFKATRNNSLIKSMGHRTGPTIL